MLVIISTHPIQYQVPLWQALAKDGRVPFEVWYLTHHAVHTSHDAEFRKAFAWDLDLLAGYPHRLLRVFPGALPTAFRECRLLEPLDQDLLAVEAQAVWIQGWQVQAYWQAVWAARRAGCKVWLRGESNGLAPVPWWKARVKQAALGQLFQRVDRFLCIGTANRRFYEAFGISAERLLPAPYAVDNDRFAKQAGALAPQRARIRAEWGIAEDAFVVMFCGKFIPKKRPQDLVEAARRMQKDLRPHLLFVGAGELGGELRRGCRVAYDAESAGEVPDLSAEHGHHSPLATFAGFLNQTEISRAYVAADLLVLPSDYGETWGLVVNEAMASGVPCIISDRCGSAEDLGRIEPNGVVPFADVDALASALTCRAKTAPRSRVNGTALSHFSFDRTVETIAEVWSEGATTGRPMRVEDERVVTPRSQ